MELAETLYESFLMMLERPQLFIPRLVSTVLGSVLIIGWITEMVSTKLFFLLVPIDLIIASFAPVMVASMVKQENRKDILMKGFRETLGHWKPVIGLAAITLLLSFITALPLGIGASAYLITDKLIYALIGGILSLTIVFAVAFGLYFVPITIIESGRLSKSLSNSFKTSSKNRAEVTALVLFSLAVLVFSSMMTGILRDIGLAVFFTGRVISSVVGTYILVISPNYYLKGAEN